MVWIEIVLESEVFYDFDRVTTRAVVWIEIPSPDGCTIVIERHHPCGGVD